MDLCARRLSGGILKKYDGELLDADKQHMIGASYMTMNNEFYNIVSEEIIQRVEAEGDQGCRIISKDLL